MLVFTVLIPLAPGSAPGTRSRMERPLGDLLSFMPLGNLLERVGTFNHQIHHAFILDRAACTRFPPITAGTASSASALSLSVGSASGEDDFRRVEETIRPGDDPDRGGDGARGATEAEQHAAAVEPPT